MNRIILLSFFILLTSSCTKPKTIEEAIKRNDLLGFNQFLETKNYSMKDLNPLHLAANYRRFDMVAILIKKGFDINKQTDFGWTPLAFAVGSGDLRITKLLLSFGAKINLSDKLNTSPLHFAIRQKNYKMVKLLIENGADLNQEVMEGTSCQYDVPQKPFKISPLTMAEEMDDTFIIEILKKNGAK